MAVPTAGCPREPCELSPEQERFLDRAVEGLAQDGKIICVRLALFADMIKGKPWTTATLSQVGGTEGLGVTFLEETFSASTAPAAHRLHQKAAQAVLKALLPEAGTDIKGSRQSYEALLEASGYAQRPGDFDDLLQILDSEIRLITPTVPEGEDVGEGDCARCLTHVLIDYAHRRVLPAHARLPGALAARLAHAQAERDTARPSGAETGGTSGTVERQAGEPTSAVALRVREYPHVDQAAELDRSTAQDDEAGSPCTRMALTDRRVAGAAAGVGRFRVVRARPGAESPDRRSCQSAECHGSDCRLGRCGPSITCNRIVTAQPAG